METDVIKNSVKIYAIDTNLNYAIPELKDCSNFDLTVNCKHVLCLREILC